MQNRMFAGLLGASLGLVVAGSTAKAAFVVYDDFDNQSSLDTNKWTVISGSTAPVVSGGTATFNNDFIRSNISQGLFPVGATPTTVRFVFTSITGGAVVFGTDSNAPTNGFASGDALFARDDGGNPVYTRSSPASSSTGQGSFSNPLQAVPGTVDFVFGTSGLQVIQTPTAGSPVTLFSGSTAAFDEAQLIEVGAYNNPGNSTLVLDAVLVDVPEPASLGLLGLAAIGMVTRRVRH